MILKVTKTGALTAPHIKPQTVDLLLASLVTVKTHRNQSMGEIPIEMTLLNTTETSASRLQIASLMGPTTFGIAGQIQWPPRRES